jgi:hypothetical protein
VDELTDWSFQHIAFCHATCQWSTSVAHQNACSIWLSWHCLLSGALWDCVFLPLYLVFPLRVFSCSPQAGPLNEHANSLWTEEPACQMFCFFSRLLKKQNRTIRWSSNLTLGYTSKRIENSIPKRHFLVHVYWSVIHNSTRSGSKSSKDERIKGMCHIHTTEYYSVSKWRYHRQHNVGLRTLCKVK